MGKQNDKKARILNAMKDLIVGGKGLSSSVSEIAKAAGIGKGTIYYYFDSKEKIVEALIFRTYGDFIENCKAVLITPLNALEKLKLLFQTYYGQSAEIAMDAYLHLPQNADLHQKSLSHIVLEMSPIVAEIIRQGVGEGTFSCCAPNEYAQIILTVLAFLFDYGIFKQDRDAAQKRLRAFAEMLEKSLGTQEGGFAFFYEQLS